jgi:hypothetical protein
MNASGTIRRYDAGCDCEKCKAAHNRYRAARRAEQMAGVFEPKKRRGKTPVAKATTLEELLKEW